MLSYIYNIYYIFLESYCSPVYIEILKKLALTPVKDFLSNRIDELTVKSEGKQPKSKKSSFFHIPLYGAPPEGMAQVWGGSSLP